MSNREQSTAIENNGVTLIDRPSHRGESRKRNPQGWQLTRFIPHLFQTRGLTYKARTAIGRLPTITHPSIVSIQSGKRSFPHPKIENWLLLQSRILEPEIRANATRAYPFQQGQKPRSYPTKQPIRRLQPSHKEIISHYPAFVNS